MCQLDGNVICCGQHTGNEVQLRIFGDEFYARYETTDGYTVVYDIDVGCYCYVRLASGRFVSSGVPAGKPVPGGTRRHLKETSEVRNEKFTKRYEGLRPAQGPGDESATRTFGGDNGLLSGEKITGGDVEGLTILVEFADVKTSVTVDDVDALLNGDNYHAHGNHCSVKEYFRTVSTGKLNYTNRVVGPVTLAKKRGHYIGTLLVKEAVDAAVDQFDLDMSEFDSTGSGVVDAINILHAGTSQYSGNLWPHNSFRQLDYDGTGTHFYMLTGIGSSASDLSIGTICHENGHMLCRFPDMYDYGKRDGDHEKSQGIGRYCLMGSGNHLDHGRTPSPVCAYLRELAGWVDDVVVLSGADTRKAKHGAYNSIYKWETDVPNEYFLLENRSKFGLDSHLPANGLALYHCDTLGSNEWQDGTRLKHYQCALLQADGFLELENNLNAGGPGDLYGKTDGVALSNVTKPSSRQWDGSDSSLVISDIGKPAKSIQFRVGNSVVDHTTHGEEFPNLLIPDDKATGVFSVIDIDEAGKLDSLKVKIEIIHTWISDLTVSIESPAGTTATLHKNEGDDGDDIFKTYSMDSFAALEVFDGEEIRGEWRLRVVDRARFDVGRLLSWRIDIGFQPSGGVVNGKAEPQVLIPDNHSTGVSSQIGIGDEGNLREIRVVVDIDHTFIGDLVVDLVAPSGVHARLHDNTGYSQNDLKRSYDLSSSAALTSLVDQPIAGDWTLHVRDLARIDTGTLNSWELEISY